MTTTAWWKEPTGAQWMSFLAAWLGWVLDAFDFTVFLLAMPHIAKEFGITTTVTAASITLTLLIRLIGGLMAGAAADRWGRKLPLMISIAWFSLCDTAVYFAPSFGMILALRALFGLGMGAEWTAGATLAMENWPARTRGVASGILQGGYPVGYLLAAATSAWVIPQYGWRVLFLIAAAPLLVIFPIRFWVPESAEWKNAKTQKEPSIRRKELLPILIWASLLCALGFATNFGLTGVYPTLLSKEFGLGPQEIGRLVAIFNVGSLLGTAWCGYLAAKKSFVWATVFSAVGLLPILPLYTGLVPGHLAAGAFLAGSIGLGFAAIVPLMLHTFFPAELRARAVGFVYHVGAFLAAFVPLGVAALGESPGWTLRHAVAVVVAVCCALLVLVLTVRPKATTAPAKI
ncbi:MAG: MFS transporter [Myxococcaceae bacterium]